MGELALTMQLIIVPYFWFALWPVESIKVDNSPGKKAGMIMDHSVPLILLVIDYIFMNANPIPMRHIWIVLTVSIVYLAMNCIVTLTWKPVYEPMTWHGTALILPLVLLIAGMLIYIGLSFLSQWKLNKLGYDTFLNKVERNKSTSVSRGTKSVAQARIA